MNGKIRVLVADDHSIVRMGLATLIETQCDMVLAGQAANGRIAVDEALRTKPDVVVMDLMMPVLDGADATREITRKLPGTKVVIFTTYPTSDLISCAINGGAAGAIFKSAADVELVDAIRAVAAGGTFISEDVARLITSDPPAPPLSPRQKEILSSIVRGLSNSEIAMELGISPTAVREHTMALFQKLKAANRTEAAAIAMRKHLLPEA